MNIKNDLENKKCLEIICFGFMAEIIYYLIQIIAKFNRLFSKWDKRLDGPCFCSKEQVILKI